MAGTNKVVDDVRGRCVPACAAKPFAASEALDDCTRVVDSAVAVA